MIAEDRSVADENHWTDIMSATRARTIRGVEAVTRIKKSMNAAIVVDLYRTPMRLNGTAKLSAIAKAAIPSRNVLTERRHTRPLTGTRKYVDSPKSPVTALESHRKYLIGSG
jgi:hypothetical protein